MAKIGWISIHRRLEDHWLWQEKRVFSRAEAWLDLLMQVNHTDQKTVIKNTLFTVNKGESIKSLSTWASRWNWDKNKVRRFFLLLEKDGMILIKNEHKTTRLTICNYDSYQDGRNANETQMKRSRNGVETELTPNNNDNNYNNENNDDYEGSPKKNILDDDVLYGIERLKNYYLDFDKVVNAVCNNPDNRLKKENLEDRLKSFNNHLLESGVNLKRWNDYASHFLRWHKVNTKKSISGNRVQYL